MGNNLGLGVMIRLLGGNEETINAFQLVLGKRIEKVWLDEEENILKFEFEGGFKLSIWDDGQSCCENRYMKTDDNLTDFVGSILIDAEIKDGPDVEDGGESHEIQFLDIKTDKGTFQLCSHNEHNGYYGGFMLIARNK